MKAANLKADAALNGTLGTVTGQYENGRVGVNFAGPHGVKAVRPDNLVLENGEDVEFLPEG